jgi:hypothetical protein
VSSITSWNHKCFLLAVESLLIFAVVPNDAANGQHSAVGSIAKDASSIVVPTIVVPRSSRTKIRILVNSDADGMTSVRLDDKTSCSCNSAKLVRGFDERKSFEFDVEFASSFDQLKHLSFDFRFVRDQASEVVVPCNLSVIVGSPLLPPTLVKSIPETSEFEMEFTNVGDEPWCSLTVSLADNYQCCFHRKDGNDKRIWIGRIPWSQVHANEFEGMVQLNVNAGKEPDDDDSRTKLTESFSVRVPETSPFRWIRQGEPSRMHGSRTSFIAILKTTELETPPRVIAKELDGNGNVGCKLIRQLGSVYVYQIDFECADQKSAYVVALCIGSDEKHSAQFRVVRSE